MASSLASIAETWPENVLPQWQQKNAYAKNNARSYNLRAIRYFLHKVQFFAGIGPAHFPAETTRPLGRGCLPFSPSLYLVLSRLCFRHSKCAVQSYEKQIWHCPNLSVFVGFCQFLSVFGTMLFFAAKLRKRKLAMSVYVSLCQSMSLYVTLCHFPINCLFLASI